MKQSLTSLQHKKGTVNEIKSITAVKPLDNNPDLHTFIKGTLTQKNVSRTQSQIKNFTVATHSELNREKILQVMEEIKQINENVQGAMQNMNRVISVGRLSKSGVKSSSRLSVTHDEVVPKSVRKLKSKAMT